VLLDIEDTTVAGVVETPVTAEPVEADTFAVTVVPAVVVMPVTNVPVLVDTPETTVALVVETPVTALPVEAVTLAVIVVPAVVVLHVTTVAVDVVTPVTALQHLAPWVCLM
jgi:hypothetical protein